MENATNEPIQAGLDAAMQDVKEPEEVFSTRDALDFIDDTRADPEQVWGGLQFVPGQIMEVIGASGLGKSRILLNLAINQVLGLDFAGMSVMQQPLNWLFYGNENSFFRFRKDLRKMTSSLASEQREKLRGHIFLPSMEKATDSLVSFSDPRNVEKLKATIRQRKANVVVMDPWGAIIDGDECTDGDVRNTLVTVQKILAARENEPAEKEEKGKEKKSPPTVVGIIINHSRNGIREEIDAAGANKANFGKNSKAIYSVVRCVWNLRRAELSDHPKKIELIHAKSSDIEPYPSVAVDFDPDTFLYNKDPEFQHAIWQAALEKAYRQGNAAMTPEERNEAKAGTEEILRKDILEYIKASPNNGSISREDLGDWLRDKQKLAENAIRKTISGLNRNGKISILCNNKHHTRLICTPEKAQSITESAPDAYRFVDPPLPTQSTAQTIPCSTLPPT